MVENGFDCTWYETLSLLLLYFLHSTIEEQSVIKRYSKTDFKNRSTLHQLDRSGTIDNDFVKDPHIKKND